MKSFVPEEKMNKRARREIEKSKRSTWQMNPVTRKTENKKAYNRKKVRSDSNDFYQPGL